MGRVGAVLEFTRLTDEAGNVAEVKCDLGGGNIVTAHHYAPPGDDSHPLAGDFAVLVDAEGTGNWVAVGFMDPELAGTAGPGERIVYSRSAPGVIASKLWLKADGSIDLNDGAAVLGADGVLTVGADVVGGGKSLKSHAHGYIDSKGSAAVATPSQTDPPS